MNERLAKLSAKLGDLESEAFLVVDEVNVRYLTGFTGDSTWLLVRSGDSMLLSDGRYTTQLAQECPGMAVAIRPPSQKIDELFVEIAGSSSPGKIAIEADHVSVSRLETWKESLPDHQWQRTTGVIEDLRAIKDDVEIATIRRAIEIAERSFRSVIERLTPRMTEIDVYYELEATMRHLGAEGVSFSPIVGAEPRGALPHYHPQALPLGDCRTLLIDWGAKVGGYCSDLTRTLHRARVRSENSDRFESAYQVVLEAQEAAIAKIAAGTPTVDVDSAARDVLTRAGLGEAFMHGLGHGFGLEIHESPRMGPSSEGELQAGMVVTVEPGVYFANDFGIRIEDDVLVTETGCERLSELPKGLDDCRLVM